MYGNEGRRRELILSSVLYFFGALLTALAPNLPIMVVGRFIFGIGIGLVSQLNYLIFIYFLIVTLAYDFVLYAFYHRCTYWVSEC